MKGTKCILLYLFPLCVFVSHLIAFRQFVIDYWVLYVIASALLIYSHYRLKNNREEGIEINIRRFYFTYFIFLMIFLHPEFNKFNILQNNLGILGLSNIPSMYIIFFVVAIVIYFIVIANFNISEISIGSAKLTLLKEKVTLEKEKVAMMNEKIELLKNKYAADINDHMNLVNTLLDKISAEHYITQNLMKYCMEVMERLHSPDDVLVLSKECQTILSRYYRSQKNDAIEVSVLDNSDDFINEYSLNKKEVLEFTNKMKYHEAYGLVKKGIHFLTIPYESLSQKIYIILKSNKPIISDAEIKIIHNILTGFTDRPVSLSRCQTLFTTAERKSCYLSGL